MSDMLTEVRFWAQVMGDAERTIVCAPDVESRVKGWIYARGMGAILHVVPNPVCPADRIYIIDEKALQADFAQTLQTYRPSFTQRAGVEW